MDYNPLKTFIKVSELGSFTKAAQILNQPKSRISRAISRLEEQLGVQLIRRTTRKMTLTNSGQEFYLGVLPLLRQLEQQLVKVTEQQQQMTGLLRITAPEDLGQTLLVPILSRFIELYPDVNIETILTNKRLDLTKENIDISFRAGALQDSNLTHKRLMDVNFIIVCSKTYLEKYGYLKKIEDLQKHRFFSFRNIEQDLFKQSIKLKPQIISNNVHLLLKLVLNGDGISILPDYFCKEALLAKELVHLFPSVRVTKGRVHILFHPSQNTSLKIKEFIRVSQELVLNKK